MTDSLGRLPLAALILLALATACSGPSVGAGSSPTSTAGGTRSGSGTLHGHLYGVGGPAPGAPRPFPGTITVSGNGTRWEAEVNSDGAFSITVSPGRYTVTGHSPAYGGGAYPCKAPNPVQISNGSTTTLDVYCQMK